MNNIVKNFNLDACLKQVSNKYELVLFAKSRYDEIASGSSIMIQKDANEKMFFSALKEISNGLHDSSSLNEKLLTNIRNDISGISVKTALDANSVDKFDEESLFTQIFRSIDTSSKNIDSGDIFAQNESNDEQFTEISDENGNDMDFS